MVLLLLAVRALPANLGAVQMARAELAGFPSGQWDDGSHVEQLLPAERWLQRAVRFNPDHAGASYRLGLIALLRQDFPAAAGYLELAQRADPGHYGVRKNLAYTYIWLGRAEKALPLLQTIPEARGELEAYTNWWRRQRRPDLAQAAERIFHLETAP